MIESNKKNHQINTHDPKNPEVNGDQKSKSEKVEHLENGTQK
jgi:hypothetical protein